MAIIISISGMTGTGKSTCARYISSNLHRAGLPNVYVRYRLVSLRSFFERPRTFRRFVMKRAEDFNPPVLATPRFANYRFRRASHFWAFLPLLVWRVVLFRILVQVRFAKTVVLVDRCFYDSLIHYPLRHPGYARLAQWVMRLLPAPDLALMVHSPFETVRKRRPEYDERFLREHLANYLRLAELRPDIVLVTGDDIEAKMKRVNGIVTRYLADHIPAPTGASSEGAAGLSGAESGDPNN